MLSVECYRDEIEAVVNLVNATGKYHVDITCYNRPRSYVLAGDTLSLKRAAEECQSFKMKQLGNMHATTPKLQMAYYFV